MENITKFNSLLENFSHVAFTDHEDVPEMISIKETLKISEVESTVGANDANKWRF